MIKRTDESVNYYSGAEAGMTLKSGRPRGRPRDRELTARRKEEILDRATRVFAERGYPKTDVQLVADASEVGKGTVYRYFPTKRSLFLAAVDRGICRLRDAMHAGADRVSEPMEKIRNGVRAYLAFFDANPELIELLIQERAEFKDRKTPTYFVHQGAGSEPWKRLLRELIADGRVRAIPPEQITGVVGDLLYGTIFTNYFSGRRRSFEQQASDILDLIFHGILTEKERARTGRSGNNHRRRI